MRLAITSHDLIGDTLMQTPALRALRRAYPGDHIVYYTDNRYGAHAVLIGNPNLDELVIGPAGPADIAITLSSLEAFARAGSRSLADGYATCLGVMLDDRQLDYVPSEAELAAGEELARSFGKPDRVVVVGRHTRSCMSNQGGTASDSVHDGYVRQPVDLPWRGHGVRLRVRRFHCQNPQCDQATFAEDFAPTLARYARRTSDTLAFLCDLASKAGGEAGVRLAQAARLPTSPDTLLVKQHLAPTHRGGLGWSVFDAREARRSGLVLRGEEAPTLALAPAFRLSRAFTSGACRLFVLTCSTPVSKPGAASRTTARTACSSVANHPLWCCCVTATNARPNASSGRLVLAPRTLSR